MENEAGSIILGLAGINNREWDINYFNITKYEESGNNTRLTLNGHLCKGESMLLVALSIKGFELVYNQAKAHIEHLQTITFNSLGDIQERYIDYFERSKTNIKDNLIIHWTEPVQIEFSAERELPKDIRSEIEEKFWRVS